MNKTRGKLVPVNVGGGIVDPATNKTVPAVWRPGDKYGRIAEHTRAIASAYQVHCAYEAHFGCKMPGSMTFQQAAWELCKALGSAESVRFILSQPNG